MIIDFLETTNTNNDLYKIDKIDDFKFQGLSVRHTYLMNKGLFLLMYEQDMLFKPDNDEEADKFCSQLTSLNNELLILDIPIFYFYITFRNKILHIDLKNSSYDLDGQLTIHSILQLSSYLDDLVLSVKDFTLTNTYEITDILEQLCDRKDICFDKQGHRYAYKNDKFILYSDKDNLQSFKFCKWLGFLGAHKFYLGQVGQGFIYLITLGGLGTLWFADLLSFNCNTMKDKHGYPLVPLLKEEKSWLSLLLPIIFTICIFLLIKAL